MLATVLDLMASRLTNSLEGARRVGASAVVAQSFVLSGTAGFRSY